MFVLCEMVVEFVRYKIRIMFMLVCMRVLTLPIRIISRNAVSRSMMAEIRRCFESVRMYWS